jgi:hypothetical protein
MVRSQSVSDGEGWQPSIPVVYLERAKQSSRALTGFEAGPGGTGLAGRVVRFGAGDLVTFPMGMHCRWTIHKAVRKHYTFD